MKKALVFSSGALALLLVPAVSFAATQISDINGIGTFIIATINNLVVPVLFAIAFIVFVWGAFQAFILGHNSDDAHKQGKNLMLWGLVGFFVMVSVWGLVNILTGTITFGNPNPPNYPSAPHSANGGSITP